MNTTNFTVMTVLVEDWLVASITICVGTWIIVSNALLLIAVKNQNGNKNYILQSFFFSADIVLGCGSIVANADRLRTLFINDWYTSYYCIAITTVSFFGDIFSHCLICVMSLERLIAAAFPFAYRNWNQKLLSFTLMFMALSFTTICTGITFYKVDNTVKPVECTGASARYPPLGPLLAYVKGTVGSISVLLNVALVLCLKLRMKLKKAILISDNEEAKIFKSEVKACIVLTTIVTSGFTFSVLPSAIAIITIMEKGIVAVTNYGYYGSLFGLLESSSNIILYLWKDEKIHQAFLKIMKKKAAVQNLPSN